MGDGPSQGISVKVIYPPERNKDFSAHITWYALREKKGECYFVFVQSAWSLHISTFILGAALGINVPGAALGTVLGDILGEVLGAQKFSNTKSRTIKLQ